MSAAVDWRKQLDRQLAAHYTGGDTSVVGPELRSVIEDAITNQPRSLQTRIGPSELGTDCVRCLVSKLAGIPEERDAAWLPFVGTSVHEQLDQVFTQHARKTDRYMTETKVTVGKVGGVEITGHADLFDMALGVVVDWKCVGATTLRTAKANGPSPVYRTQAHLYGKGFQDAGFTVQAVAIYYLPRNEPSLANALCWQEPYDRAMAEKAIARADMFAVAIAMLGADQVLKDSPPHVGGFSCCRYDSTLPKPGHRPSSLHDLIA